MQFLIRLLVISLIIPERALGDDALGWVIAAVPLGFAFYRLFNPASGSEELITILWFGAAVIL